MKWQEILFEFRQICAIPHASNRERELRCYLEKRLREKAAFLRCDAAGNLMAKFPASETAAPDAPAVILQAHMDMVVAGEKPPEAAAVRVRQVDGWLETDGQTSLGADNGIGISIILALLKRPELVHGPLYVLFTVAEEVGLKGASRVPREFLNEARYLINLDGFHADTVMVGCKGGLREHLWYPIRWQTAPAGGVAFRIRLEGFLGGHSGDDIDRGRCNTIRMLARLLQGAWARFLNISVSDLSGGIGFNVIPAACAAEVVLPVGEAAAFAAAVREEGRRMLLPYRDSDGQGRLEIETIPYPEACWTGSTQRDILRVLTLLTDGVAQRDGEGAVSASCNMGHVYMTGDVFHIEDMLRCDTAVQETAILQRHMAVAGAAGFRRHVAGYHSWHGRREGRLLRVVEEVYRTQHDGGPMQVKTALVGVEPAYFQEKAPELEMICLGADIENAHSVRERVSCDSAAALSNLLEKTLHILAGGSSDG